MPMLLDIGVSDVHIPGTSEGKDPMPSDSESTELTVSAEQRKSMRPTEFADPENRKYPIHDAAHVRNAAARLEQQKGSMSSSKYREIRGRIARAARRFGVESEYNKKPTRASSSFGRGLRMTTYHPDGSRTVVHHMSAFADDAGEKLILSLPLDKSQALAAGDSDGRVWVQVAKTGRWLGHRQGPFTLTAKDFDDICANFLSQGVGRIQWDFEHASELPPNTGEIPAIGAPSQGWAYGFKHDGTHLYALTAWGTLARSYLENDQYGGVSPAIKWNQKDRHTGKPIGTVISSLALTNKPFITGMDPPLAASAGEHFCVLTLDDQTTEGRQLSQSCCYSNEEFMPQIKAALKLHELSTPQEMSEHVGKLRELMDMAGGDHTKSINGVNLADFAVPLRGLVNAHAGMSWDEVFDVVEDLIDVAMDRHIIQDHGGVEESTSPEIEGSTTSATSQQLSTTEAVSVASQTAPIGGTMPAPTDNKKTAEALELEVMNLTGERTTLLSQIDTLTKERDGYKAKVEEHEAQVLSARVDLAFDTYKDKNHLPPNAKSAMLHLLQVDAAGFESLYPKLEAPQRHLLSVLTTDERAASATAPRSRATETAQPTLLSNDQGLERMSAPELTTYFMRTTKCSLGDAQVKADNLLRSIRNRQLGR